jgi:hypothetical protein
MSLENSIEKLIADAMERGEFDNLKGKGKRLNLDEYFNTPEDLRMAHSVLKANEFVPKEVDLINEVADLRRRAAAATDDAERNSLTKRLNERELALRLEIERRRIKRRT